MLLTVDQLLDKLPNKEFWFTSEIAEAFNVSRRTVQGAASVNQIGMKVRQGPRGTYVFQKDDLESLCNHIHGEVGNPDIIARKRKKNAAIMDQFLEKRPIPVLARIGPQDPLDKVAA
jgi:DNA-binding GntR family transcriptional regulator